MAEASASFDWDDARRRIDRLGDQLAQGEIRSAEQTAAVLRARAERLAKVEAAPSPGASIEVMVMGLADEKFALETRLIREVTRPTQLTNLPGAADHFAGLANLRGRPLLVVDGRQLLGLPCGQQTASARVIVIGVDRAEFGMLVDLADEVLSLETSCIRPTPQNLPEQARGLLRGVTSDALAVFDSELLLADPALWIEQED